MRTATENPQTKQDLMDVATKLMIQQGYTATTIDQICEETKVTKGSFFHYFKNKEDLGKQLIKRFSEKMGRSLLDAECCKSPDPLERIFGYIEQTMQMANDPKLSGCLVGTLTQEISSTHPELRNSCCQSFDEMRKFLRGDFVQAKVKYAPKASFNAESLADYFMAVIQGSLLLRKANPDGKAMVENLKHLETYIKSLFGK